MLIKNLKSGKESVVSKIVWDNMVDTKRSMLFKVIDTTDRIVAGKGMIPKQITEFKVNMPERIAITVDHKTNEEQGIIMAEQIINSKPIKKFSERLAVEKSKLKQ